MIKLIKKITTCVTVMLSFLLNANAQVTTATVSGIVNSISGEALAKAGVTVEFQMQELRKTLLLKLMEDLLSPI